MTLNRRLRWGMPLALLVVAAGGAWAMDLRDLPQWVRDSIELVWVDWEALAGTPAEEPGEVHLWVPEELAAVTLGARDAPGPVQPVHGAQGGAVPPAVGLDVPRTVIPPRRDAQAVTVRLPDLGAAEAVHLAARAGAMPGPVEVRAPGAVGLGDLEGVHLADMAEQMTKALADIEGLDQETLAKAGQIVTMIREQKMTAEEFVEWARQNEIGPEAISTALALGGDRWHFADEDRLLAAGLLDAAGQQLESLEKIPVWGRPDLAVYLGLLGREEDAKAVLSSMSPAELASLPGNAFYYVATELLRHGKSLRTAIWAWKTEAARRGAMDRALVCFELTMACERLRDPDVVREELIPWAEKALAMPASESQWHRALPAVLWAYDYLGDPQKAVQRGRYWLQQAEERRVAPERLAGIGIWVASALTDLEQFREAGDVLREVIARGPEPVAERAQVELLRLAEGHAAVGPAEVLPPRLGSVRPEGLGVRVSIADTATRLVSINGNATLRIHKTRCSLPFVSVTPQQPQPSKGGSRHVLELRIEPLEEMGLFNGSLMVTTNDSARPSVTVPITVHVTAGIRASPGWLFFGMVEPGGVASAEVALTSHVPFTVTEATPDDPELVTIQTAQQEVNRWIISATLRAPNDPCVVEGNVQLSTDLECQALVHVHYYAEVRDRD